MGPPKRALNAETSKCCDRLDAALAVDDIDQAVGTSRPTGAISPSPRFIAEDRCEMLVDMPRRDAPAEASKVYTKGREPS